MEYHSTPYGHHGAVRCVPQRGWAWELGICPHLLSLAPRDLGAGRSLPTVILWSVQAEHLWRTSHPHVEGYGQPVSGVESFWNWRVLFLELCCSRRGTGLESSCSVLSCRSFISPRNAGWRSLNFGADLQLIETVLELDEIVEFSKPGDILLGVISLSDTMQFLLTCP